MARRNSEPMNSRLRLAVSLIAVLGVVTLSVHMRSDAPSELPSLAAVATDPLSGDVLVDLVDDASDADERAITAMLQRAIAPYRWSRGLGVELSDEANLYRLHPPASEVADILAALRADERVEAVEAEGIWALPGTESASSATQIYPLGPSPWSAPAAADSVTPNDPYYANQWHLDQIGMPAAWPAGCGAGATVAVIDTGVAHRNEAGFTRAPDLAQTRIVPGWDFVHNDPHPDDEHGHGTHVAGTIAQSTNNALGVAGVAPGAAIMPLQVLDRSGSGGWGAIAASIRFAADHGANVINMSLGGGAPSRTVQRAIDYAHSKGVVVVAAAGNSARSRVEYPGAHRHVIAVGAVRFDRTLSFYSNYGKNLDLVAPGGDIRVDQNGDGLPDGVLQNTLALGDPNSFDYLAWQGTSMASPHVAGVAALLVGSGVTDPDRVEQLLLASAADIGDQRHFGAGLLSAPASLDLAAQEGAASRSGAVIVFGLLLFWGERRRSARAAQGGKLRHNASVLGLALLLVGVVGLLPFRALGLGPVGLVEAEISNAWAVSASSWAGPALFSVLPFFALAVLTLHLKRLRPLLLALGLSTTALLTVEALWPSVGLGLLPSVAIGPWLLLNAAAAFALTRMVRRA